MHISTKLKMTRQMETGVSINHTYQGTLFDHALLALA